MKTSPLGPLIKFRAATLYRAMTTLFRVTPDFIIIGVTKGGTTSLLKYLEKHPQIKVSWQKEIHFFGSYNFDKGVNWYKKYFPLSLSQRNQFFQTGEASPEYFCKSTVVPAQIKEVFPDIKLILLLRNPIDRAYSHYLHRYRIGAERSENFAQLVLEEKSRLIHQFLDCNWGENFDVSSLPSPGCFHLGTGLYFLHLRKWVQYFSLDQMLILKSEDFFSYPNDSLHRVTQFLQLPDLPDSSWKVYNASPENPELDSQVREDLNEFFDPYNQRLYDYLGTDFNWH
ncbi:sulfotransferase domain-containing protein [Spirulina sp. CS-785/01]|uniref:sulfotransferase domain-containing protein n=1 Tax=Spirulina sp. CS-785/01 TaxID=3021716 RepID=UPI00232C4380|nr:sulfotransferase domain-containing protein [Spirulina sp. CS-785/01]MDB9314127.1 sulfotransferase domain-containing protein [Spirulina sp. CS-785/01]